MWTVIIVVSAVCLAVSSFTAGCFWIASGKQVEEDWPKWLDELEKK